VFNSTDSTAKLRKLKVISHISQNLLQGRQQFPAKFKYWLVNDNSEVLTECPVSTTVRALRLKQYLSPVLNSAEWRC
jgi:hypothetical protein